MKRLLLVLVMCGMLVMPVLASMDFQNSGDKNNIITPGSDSVVWVRSGVGGNSYIKLAAPGGGTYWLQNANGNPFTYLAFTQIASATSTGGGIQLYDVSNTSSLYSYGLLNNARWEVSIVGSTAYLYRDGILMSTSGVLAQTPSYYYLGGWLGFPSDRITIDDIVVGDSDSKTVVGFPESDVYVIKKDFTNPAASGFYYASNGTLISSTNLPFTFARSNLTGESLQNESIYLVNVDTGVNYETQYTGTSVYASKNFNVASSLFSANAPYGRYYAHLGNSYSEEIWYLGSGATISFDKDTYSGQDTATMTYSVLGAYWDTSTYSYTIDVVSGTTGATMQSTAISASSGTDTYTFTSTDPLGVYYTIVKATKLSDSSVIWMNYDYAELSSYVTIQGYVNDAETGLPISGANINITQNSIINNLTTIADGNYSATNYLSGAPIAINATAPLHRQYTYTFTPLSAKTIDLNVSLVATTPSVGGLGIGGVARDIAYGRPLPSVSVWVINASNAESYTKTTSMTGWYLCDEGATCFLTTGRLYDVWGEKVGYSNSPNYTVVAA